MKTDVNVQGVTKSCCLGSETKNILNILELKNWHIPGVAILLSSATWFLWTSKNIKAGKHT